jgi:hypothetical protein
VQQDRRGFPGRVVVVGLLAAVALTGCSGDAQSELAKATDRAKRLYDKACTHLHDPVYRYQNDFAPLPRLVRISDPNAIRKDIRPQDVGVLNPRAWEAIQQAEKELVAALGKAGGADSAVVHNANVMLARVYALKGFHKSLEANRARDRAWDALEELEQAAIDMADHGKRIASCDKLLGVSDPAVGEMADKAKTDAEAAAAATTKLEGEITALQQEKKSLDAANQTLMGEARQLHVKSRLAEAIKGIELFDQAQAKEAKATANAARIAEIEDTIRQKQGRLAELKLAVASADERKTAAADITNARQQRRTTLKEQRDGFFKRLADSQKAVETLAAKAAAACAKVAAVEKAGLDACTKAEKAYEKLTAKRRAEPPLHALHGDTLMARGDLRVAALILKRRASFVTKEVTKLWSSLPVPKDVPAVIATVDAYLPNADAERETARGDFRFATRHYEDALKPVPNRRKWVYRLQVATAYAGLYRLSADDDARQKGSAALDALGDEESSPYVASHVTHLRKLLSEAPLGVIPAPAPSTTPAP